MYCRSLKQLLISALPPTSTNYTLILLRFAGPKSRVCSKYKTLFIEINVDQMLTVHNAS